MVVIANNENADQWILNAAVQTLSPKINFSRL